MIIQTKRLQLRKFEKTDIVWYEKFAKSYETKTILPNLATDSLERAERDIDIFIKGDLINDYYLVICNEEKIIGLIDAVRYESNVLDVSYFVFADYRGNGYMVEAVSALIDYARKINPKYVFRFSINSENVYSLNVVKKLGATISRKDDTYICYF